MAEEPDEKQKGPPLTVEQEAVVAELKRVFPTHVLYARIYSVTDDPIIDVNGRSPLDMIGMACDLMMKVAGAVGCDVAIVPAKGMSRGRPKPPPGIITN